MNLLDFVSYFDFTEEQDIATPYTNMVNEKLLENIAEVCRQNSGKYVTYGVICIMILCSLCTQYWKLKTMSMKKLIPNSNPDFKFGLESLYMFVKDGVSRTNYIDLQNKSRDSSVTYLKNYLEEFTM